MELFMTTENRNAMENVPMIDSHVLMVMSVFERLIFVTDIQFVLITLIQLSAVVISNVQRSYQSYALLTKLHKV